jgi:hypothetical protein
MEVRRVILKESISKNDVFSESQEAVDAIIQDLNILLFMPEDVICKQGNEGVSLYFIAGGDWAVYVVDEK